MHLPATPFVDLHVHPSLPVLGTAWRRRVQGFSLGALDGEAPPAGGPPSLHVVSLYHSFLFRPRAARRDLLRALQALRAGASDRASGYRFLGTAPELEAWGAAPRGDRFLLAVESLRFLEDPEDLERLWALGVRLAQPVHFLDTPWGRSSLEGFLPASRKGLTGLGRELLAEMGDLGMALDLAHMNPATAEESLARYRGPVLCSHTGVDSVNPSGRNLPAELAREVFRRGGVVGVTCWRHLLGRFPARLSLRDGWTQAFCGTVSALAELAPGARVAVGSDRGAPILAPGWLFTPPHLAEVEAVLARWGWDAERRRGLLSGNALAFLREALPSSAPGARLQAGPGLSSRTCGKAAATDSGRRGIRT